MEKMETLWGGIIMKTGPAFPLSTDSMVLADFADPGPRQKIADLGAGCGTLGLLLCGKYPDCAVTGIEIDPSAHAAALENIQRNALESRLTSRLADLRDVRALFAPGSFGMVISNPPYFTPGHGKSSQDPALRPARQEDACTLTQLFDAAAWLLPTGGKFCLVHRPERLADLIWEARQHQLEPKRLQMVRHSPQANYSLVLLQCRRGGKPGLQCLPDLVLYGADGAPTPETRKIYHL